MQQNPTQAPEVFIGDHWKDTMCLHLTKRVMLLNVQVAAHVSIRNLRVILLRIELGDLSAVIDAAERPGIAIGFAHQM